MAMLVAGVFSASLGLIYASIAVSILAAVTLGVGVLLRRRELFGEAIAGDIRPGWAAADVAGARSAGGRPARSPGAGPRAPRAGPPPGAGGGGAAPGGARRAGDADGGEGESGARG